MTIYVVGGIAKGSAQHHQYETAVEALAKLKECQQNEISNAGAYDDHGDQLSVSRLTFLANVDAHLNSLHVAERQEEQPFSAGNPAAWRISQQSGAPQSP